jgi:plastocyanin
VNSIRGNFEKFVFIVAGLILLLSASGASAQAGHLVLVKMVDKPNAQFAFEPAAIIAQHGDTVRFVQMSTAPHNVHFDKLPKGAKLGDAATGPYIIGDGKSYDLIIDSRFVDGAYPFLCDPHQSVGMRGTLTVGPSTKVATLAKP